MSRNGAWYVDIVVSASRSDGAYRDSDVTKAPRARAARGARENSLLRHSLVGSCPVRRQRHMICAGAGSIRRMRRCGPAFWAAARGLCWLSSAQGLMTIDFESD
ncbi:MAG TPA: hypothetical protein VFZ14_12235, partial [Burkholderiales bacterium]|nr:hypothetical protein [Burkholderiales bacterium]